MPRRPSLRDRSSSIPDDLQHQLADDPRWQALLTVARRVIGPPPTAMPAPVFTETDERTLQAAQELEVMTAQTLQWLTRRMIAYLRAQYPQIPKTPQGHLLSFMLYEGADGEPPMLLSLRRWPPIGRKPEPPKDWTRWRCQIRNALRHLRPGEEHPTQEALLLQIHRSDEDTRRVRDCWEALGYKDYKAMMDDLRPRG